MPIDPIKLSKDLIQCESVTPAEGGALQLLESVLTDAGFSCTRIDRGGIANLFARWGTGKTLGFNGHTDVVPVGEMADWTYSPFSATEDQGRIYGRGAVDMKSAVASFVAAAVDVIETEPPSGSLVIAITGDEEGDAQDGTLAILDWMDANQQQMDHCLVGEPTCPETMGEMIKIGRRGSMTAYLEAEGSQGHVAYPHRSKNPIHALIALLDDLVQLELDQGSDHFDPSTLALTTIDVGNPSNNVIPQKASATLNIRFNDHHSGASLQEMINQKISEIEAQTGVSFSTRYRISGESFFTEPDEFTSLISEAVNAETGQTPVLSTSGGTSDARFIRQHCPVNEVGLVGKTMHQVDEFVEIEQITQLTAIYKRIILGYFQ